jgi:hypothetical protein
MGGRCLTIIVTEGDFFTKLFETDTLKPGRAYLPHSPHTRITFAGSLALPFHRQPENQVLHGYNPKNGPVIRGEWFKKEEQSTKIDTLQVR